MTRPASPTRVLLAEGEPALSTLYARWLSERYAVQTVESGASVLEALDGAVDVLVLNRLLPDRASADVLEQVSRRAPDCGVLVVTTQPPDVDVLDLPFDDYLLKPVDRFTLHEGVEYALEQAAADPAVREYDRLLTKRRLIESEKTADTLSNAERYAALLDRIAAFERHDSWYFGGDSDSVTSDDRTH